jgi:hypothetical protein
VGASVPQSQLEARFMRFEEKNIAIHCNTGILAKIAHEQLIAKG